jgi:Acetyltransferase (GNAT) domain
MKTATSERPRGDGLGSDDKPSRQVARNPLRRGPSSTDGAGKRASDRQPDKQIQCELLPRKGYPEWDCLVDQSPHGTVFHYSWWLETTAKNLSILVIRDRKGTLIGGMPLPGQNRAGLRLLQNPSLTPYLGPLFDVSSTESNADRLYLMRSYGEILARSIESFDSCRYMAGANAPDLQGFLWAGFRVHLAYTFRFLAGTSPDTVATEMTRTHLQKLTKARRMNLTITHDKGVDELVRLNEKVFARQGLRPPYSKDLVARLWAQAHSHGKARIYVARMSDGTPSAALLTFHDRRTTYQIVSGVNPDLRDVPGAYLVLWHALEDALLAGRDFDFEGSGLRGVECFYRRWGAKAMPVWRIEKVGSWRGAAMQFLMRRRDEANWRKSAKKESEA